jgi:CRP-like cAMP-binding protein
MAKLDPRKLKDQAAKAVEKKSYAKAGELYLQIAQLEPDDPDWPLRAGEALRKAGELVRAARAFEVAADGYARSGALLKAIAVCKVVLQIDPSHTAIQSRLAQLYAQRDGGASIKVSQSALLRTSSGIFEVMPTSSGPAPTWGPVIEPAAAIAPDPVSSVGELVPLDEAERPRTIPPGAPMEVVPLAAVLNGRKSNQFAAVRLEDIEGLQPEASAYEISLDDEPIEPVAAPPPAAAAGPLERAFEMPGEGVEGLSLEPPAERPAVELAGPPAVEPAPERLERIDDALDLGGLLDQAPPPPPPRAPAGPLPTIPLLSSLSAAQLRHVIQHVEVRMLGPGDVVVRQGDRGGSLFVIVEGRVRVMVDEREIAFIGEGGFFGELGVITDYPRSATIVAAEPTQLLELSRKLLSEVVADSPEVLRTLLRFFRDRLLNRLLNSSALFSSFTVEDAHTLAGRFMFLELEPRMRVVQEGQRAPGLFLLLCGQVKVLRGAEELALLGPGDVFGEMSLLTNQPAMASIDTMTKCWALELPQKDFQEIMLTYPQVLDYVSELSARRQAMNTQPRTDERVDFF